MNISHYGVTERVTLCMNSQAERTQQPAYNTKL